MAASTWPRIAGLGLVAALAALAAPPISAQDSNPLNLRPGVGPTGSPSGPALGAPGGGTLEPVDSMPDLEPVDAPRRPARNSNKQNWGASQGWGSPQDQGSASGQGAAGKQAAPWGAGRGGPSRSAASNGQSPRGQRAKQVPARRVEQDVDMEESGGAMRDPNARRTSAELNFPAGSGEKLLAEAYSRSVTAAEEVDYSETIELCRAGMQAGVKGSGATYARQLMAWAYNKRGEARSASGHEADALEDFEAAVSLDNTSWRALHNRGVSYAGMGKAAEAVKDFSRTIEINRDFGLAYFNRGEMRNELGDYATAIDDFNTAARWLPGDPNVYNSRGHAHYRLREYKEAVADFNLSLKLDAGCVAALVNRGDVYADMSFYAEAAADYRRAIEADPNLGRAYQSAAWLMATCPKKEFRNGSLAVAAAKQAIELDGAKDYRYLATLAAANAADGKFDAAVAAQREALAAAPEKSRATQEKRLALYEAKKPFIVAQRDAQGRTGGELRTAPQRSATVVSGTTPQRR